MSAAAQALAKGEATLAVRVTKKDGTVQELEGDAVDFELTDELAAAMEEYKALGIRLRELEEYFIQTMSGN